MISIGSIEYRFIERFIRIKGIATNGILSFDERTRVSPSLGRIVLAIIRFVKRTYVRTRINRIYTMNGSLKSESRRNGSIEKEDKKYRTYGNNCY